MDADAFESCLWRQADVSDQARRTATVSVAVLALPQASLSNISAVFEDFQSVNMLPSEPDAPLRFAPRIVAASTEPRTTLSGLTLVPQALLDEFLYDAVVVPTLFDDGCLSDPDHGPILTEAERDWLRRQRAGGAVFSTMCSGAFALAEAGLLDGHACAMHWLYADTFRTRFPAVEAVTRRTLVVSGDRREFVTGGVSVYSSDVSLFNIARFFGPETALLFATLFGRSWSEALHDHVLMEPLESEVADRVVDLARRFFIDHIAGSGLVSAAAELANLNTQTFCRRFQRAMNRTPRAFITEIRMERARDLLTRSRLPIEEVAAKVGYSDRSTFAKTFRAKTGVSPAEYRTRFQSAAALASGHAPGAAPER